MKNQLIKKIIISLSIKCMINDYLTATVIYDLRKNL